MECPIKPRAWLKRFGLSQGQLEWLWSRSDGRCQICRKPFANAARRKMAGDHSHVTGWTRGLLCEGCNYKLGVTGEVWVTRAAEYLQHPPAKALGARHEDWADR